MTRRAILWIAAAVALGSLVPAAASCTRVGTVRVGDCDPPPKESGRKASATSSSHAARARAAERDLLAMLNRTRESRGLAPLRTSDMLQSVARRHAERMQQRGRIYHSDWIFTVEGRRALDFPARLGENVGVEHSARGLHEGFTDSPRHRKHLIDPGYSRVGIGVYERYGSYWAVQVFARWGRLPASARPSRGVFSPVAPHMRFFGFSDTPFEEPDGRVRGEPIGRSTAATAARVGGWVLVGLIGAGAVATLMPGDRRRRRA